MQTLITTFVGFLIVLIVPVKLAQPRWPILINTWRFVSANHAGWKVLVENNSALDAIVTACSTCEEEQCDHTVGWGGSPDENGETTLDAMIMDGPSHKVGSVAALRQVKNVIAVARAVLEHTEHTLLVGDQATQFALKMGFKPENLTSEWSAAVHQDWLANKCQPNYWINVKPDPQRNCGPYQPSDNKSVLEMRSGKRRRERRVPVVNQWNHDTIGVVAIDAKGRMASGTSTNGMRFKIPGRVGDSPLAGAGSYVDQEVGGAAATGDGDIIMRFLASYQAVEYVRNGLDPSKAAQLTLDRIQRRFPEASVGLVVLDKNGNYGASCIGMDSGDFPFEVSYANKTNNSSETVQCLPTSTKPPYNGI